MSDSPTRDLATWPAVTQSVQTPLGLFLLVVLTAEAILGVVFKT